MDRFTWYQAGQAMNEQILVQAGGVCVHDGDRKSKFESGTASLTSHRVIWVDSKDPECRLSLHHSLVLSVERQQKQFMRSGKIIVNLFHAPPSMQGQGPVSQRSDTSHIRLSFRQGGDEEFFRKFREALEKKAWQRHTTGSSEITMPVRRHRGAAGITAIERKMQDQHRVVVNNVNEAFEDLSKLINSDGSAIRLGNTLSFKRRKEKT